MNLKRNYIGLSKSYLKLNRLQQEGCEKTALLEYNHVSSVGSYRMDGIAAFINKQLQQ